MPEPSDHLNLEDGPRCIEIWGGRSDLEESIALPGVQTWLHAVPFNNEAEGGDVLFISSCGHGHVYRFAIADVSGHGSAVAAFAEDLRGLMRTHIEDIDQTSFARTLNREWLSAERSGRFATALFVTYYTPTGHLIVCNAGHPRPLWYRAEPGIWTLLDDTLDTGEEVENLPLGIIEPTRYSQFIVPAHEHDLLVLYTDAYIEARRHGKMLGERGLLECAATLQTDVPAVFGAALRDVVAAAADSMDDDRTLLVMSPAGAATDAVEA